MTDPTPLQKAVVELETWSFFGQLSTGAREELLSAAKQLEALQKENEEMKALNKSLHNLMISGENRGIAKGQEERDSLKSQVEELKVRNYALDGAMQDWQDISDSLKSALKMCAEDKARMDFIEAERVQLNCTMGAPGNYHYQVGCWPSQHSYRAAIDERMKRVQKALEGKE